LKHSATSLSLFQNLACLQKNRC